MNISVEDKILIFTKINEFKKEIEKIFKKYDASYAVLKLDQIPIGIRNSENRNSIKFYYGSREKYFRLANWSSLYTKEGTLLKIYFNELKNDVCWESDDGYYNEIGRVICELFEIPFEKQER